MQTPSAYIYRWFRPAFVHVYIRCKCVQVRRISMYVGYRWFGNRTEQRLSGRIRASAHHCNSCCCCCRCFPSSCESESDCVYMCVCRCVRCEGMRKTDKHSKSSFCWLLSFIRRIDVHICMYLAVCEEHVGRMCVCSLRYIVQYGVRQSGRICFSFALFFGSIGRERARVSEQANERMKK